MAPEADDTCELLCLDLPNAERIRASLPPVVESELAADTARALGDPTRLRLAVALSAGDELCVCDLAWVVRASQGLVSHHLRQLRTAGVVVSRKDGRMVMYRLGDRGRAVLTAVLGVDPGVDPGVAAAAGAGAKGASRG
ncbi:metalloregulator ArsR/SmtB family transcription factor [Pseudonocardia sp. KRD291]|uniref:ArsR/SmtB family transcription factor n=1 Tax=Pseudonocardia sp. KRD291 TaxID=2792007 RepID=UPI001C49EDBF|nr:metalloregulator ArsR/SmtB family transcription factor [Pseudonocardia sp. KRD291]MBW0103735.1 winged helix-turn-helix transcriptional regulator [Pseudonocardia sp. KRD291]